MTPPSIHWATRTLALLALPALVCAQEPPPRTLGTRAVPVPDSVSPGLRKLIASPIAPNLDAPATIEGWKQAQRLEDARSEKVAVGVATLLGAKVEAVEINGVACYRVTPKTVAPGKEGRLLFHVHGGSFVFGGGLGATSEAVLLADAAQMPALSVDYRLPPD
jgi:acetyl esterase/lipase